MRIGLTCLIASVLLAAFAASVSAADAPKGGKAVLEMRKDNGPYKKAAYSFRKATGDPAVHRNYVDLLFNKCGSLHVRMTNGQENRVCDLGKTALKDAPNEAPADAKWLNESFIPKAGHVYLEECKHNGQAMTVKFIVDEVTPDAVKLTWQAVKPFEGPDDSRRGAAGTMGQCGGAHKGEE